jgi:hypothetical protein
MAVRNYSNVATEATLTASIVAGTTSFACTSYAGFPSAPFTAVIDRGTAQEEVILVTGVVGSTLTVTRGYDNTTATSHAAGARVLHVTVAKDYVEANAHVNATTGVHGVGTPVGLTETQTLSNKTLTTPILATPSWTGVAAGASLTLSGSLGVTGALTGTTATFSGLVTASTVPTLGGHLVNKTYADALGTTAATPSTIMRRDTDGGTYVDWIGITDAPAVAAAATRKDYVDAVGTATATVSTIVRRDAAGASSFAALSTTTGQVGIGAAAPTAVSHAARKDYVDTKVSTSIAAAMQAGATTGTTDASSLLTITHNLGTVPSAAIAQVRTTGSTSASAQIATGATFTATQMQVRVYAGTAPAAGSQSWTINWVVFA